MNGSPRICPDCQKPMVAFVPPSKPSAGEFYCEEDKKSIRMTEPGEADYWQQVMKQ